jgi:hypothetical protein
MDDKTFASSWSITRYDVNNTGWKTSLKSPTATAVQNSCLKSNNCPKALQNNRIRRQKLKKTIRNKKPLEPGLLAAVQKVASAPLT